MARRSIWRGAISFGMVVIPVKLFTATESKDIRFVTLHSTCSNKLRQKRYCPYHETEVELAEVVKGYEYAKEQYLVMSDADFEQVQVPSNRIIEITRFVDLSSIDPIYFERSYVLEPDAIGIKPFYLLKQALEATERVAIAKVTLRQKEHLVCLRPFDKAISLETMFYPDEIRGAMELTLPEEETAITEQEMSMAVILIDQLTDSFEPGLYRDEYRLALEQAIEAKLVSSEPVSPAPIPPKSKVGDLMEALRASIESAKGERPSTTDKERAKRPSKRQTTAKKTKQKVT